MRWENLEHCNNRSFANACHFGFYSKLGESLFEHTSTCTCLFVDDPVLPIGIVIEKSIDWYLIWFRCLTL